MLQILAATSNKHKVEEFKAAFAPLLSKMTILTADEIHGYPDIPILRKTELHSRRMPTSRRARRPLMPTCPLLPMTPVWKSRF